MKKSKKLIILTGDYYEQCVGGAEYQAYLIAREALRRGHEVHYIFVSNGKAFKKNLNIDLHPIKKKSLTRRIGPNAFLYYFQLINLLKEINPDIIYQRTGSAFTGIATIYAIKHDKKLIWHISHDKDAKPLKCNFKKELIFNYIDKKVAGYGIQNCAMIIGQTEDQNRLLKKHYSRKCDAIIPNFHPHAAREVQKDDPIKILWVANFKHFKHPEIFVEVAKRLEGLNNVRFYMLGRGYNKKQQSRIEEEIANIKNLEYLGEKAFEEVNKFFCQAHIFVNTSDFEGFPNTFIQAWMRRVPVVSLNVDPDNILKHHGIGFHSGSFEQMIRDTERLIQNEELREIMGERAQKYAFKNHSLRNMQQIIDLFDE